MSMVKSRPQLELDELRQLKWLLGGVLALVALSALLYLELNAWPFLAVGVVAIPAVLIWPSLPARLPAWMHKLVFPAVVCYVAYDFYVHNEILSSMVRLDVLLLLYRSCHYRRRREDLQLIVLGLFLIIMAGVITVSMAFVVQIVAFVACALLFLFVITLADALEGSLASRPLALGEAPPWSSRRWADLMASVRATCDWRVFFLGGGLFVGFVVISGVLFMAIPRFELNSGFVFDRLLPKKATTGFTDVLKFGDVNDIQQDDSVVLRVEASDRTQVPQSLYWRMVVLDEYREGTFRMSTALKASSFQREMTVTRLDGLEPVSRGRLTWTFYLEPAGGRYLPLAGGFRRLLFTEPQSVRFAPQLKLAMFGRDPVSMKAYRVEDMNTSDRVSGTILPADSRNERMNGALSEADRMVLQKTVATISGGGRLGPEAFARAAMLWLARQHGYSLKSVLPAGQNDPLVRWLTSREPGHCELFAGAFALLARAAGFPTRVVSGYMGGAWNDDYLIVRNSDAHAWCEIYLGYGQWLRVDPTNDGPRLLNGVPPGASPNLVREMSQGWEARLDRLRMLWYRHIVNFDQLEQQQIVRRFKEMAEGAGRQVRDYALAFVAVVKEWLSRPWDFGRWLRLGGLVVFGSFGVFLLGWAVRKGWRQWRAARGGAMDPVRREAGLWLKRLDGAGGRDCSPDVRALLQRLRYGRRETWPQPRPVFRAAREWCRSRGVGRR